MTGNNYKAMVTFSVEVVLMRKGGPQYHLVLARLERDYNCKIFDCFEKPEYLKSVLRDVYGKEYQDIIENIAAELGEVVDEKEIAEFLSKMRE